MKPTKTTGYSTPSDTIWIISAGRYRDVDLSDLGFGPGPQRVRLYRISDLARYMLNPNPVEVQKRLVGCEVHYRNDASRSVKTRLGRFLRRRTNSGEESRIPPEIIVSSRNLKQPQLLDERLENHMNRIGDMLKPFDPAVKRLPALDIDRISDVIGICEDAGGNRSLLTLLGGTDEKIAYVLEHLNQQVGVRLERARISDGLYDISGFDFTAFDPGIGFRLLRFVHEGEARSCVLTAGGRIDFWVGEMGDLQYLQLLQHSLSADSKLTEPFRQCAEGQARPLKIFFNPSLEIDYGNASFPAIYREVLGNYPLAVSGKRTLVQALKAMQLGIAFNYVPLLATGDERLFTNLSVMHDVKALEPIRNMLPQIYSEITKRAYVSENGRFYLLDSIKGYKDVDGIQAK